MLLILPSALALSLSLESTKNISPGVVLRSYRASSPSTDVYVASIDLCYSGIYVDATRASDSTQSTKDWAATMDTVMATNADFYKTGPLRVYGDAVGGGVRWPEEQTGWDPSYSSEWYYDHYGWVAFLQDEVTYTHTGWVKQNMAGNLGGWEPTTIMPTPPPGTLALVSGFPELVVEGQAMTCSDPEASSCFPDRSDMRDRHPRTAIGLSEDKKTLFMAVVDGRTSSNSGMYGSELADLMSQVGAWVAFNLDGGGSSQMVTTYWVNDYDGNNYGSGARGVANHVGVLSGAGLPARPGHCASAAPCEILGPTGGTLDDSGACFRGFGDQDYWRPVASGNEGGLRWTNAFKSDAPDNWAWWQIYLEEGGEYEVEYLADATYSVWDALRMDVRASGQTQTLTIDPTGGGWKSLGSYTFAAGGDQWVALFDDVSGSIASNQHVVADAIRLTRVGEWCGNGSCAAEEACVCADCPVGEEVEANGLDDDCDGQVDEVAPADSEPIPDDSQPFTPDSEPPDGLQGTPVPLEGLGGGCGSGAAALLLLPLGFRRRRR
jgi:hypothetical protein